MFSTKIGAIQEQQAKEKEHDVNTANNECAIESLGQTYIKW